MESQPLVESLEKPKAKIELHFFRHDEKESDRSKTDEEIRLTEAGKSHASSLSDAETNLEQSIAFGSPRKRTLETAGFRMAGSTDNVTGSETLEELREKLDKDIGYGSKLNVDQRLDIVLPESGQYLEEGLKAFKEGKLLKWLVDESDKRFAELGVEAGYFSYSNQARQIAQIIEKYVSILPRWKELVDNEDKKYEPEMERFLGTHQTVGECFLAKVIELTKGVEERDRFVESLNGGGFDFSEGFEVDILESDSGPKIHIKYKSASGGPESDVSENHFAFDEIIDTETLSKILEK